MLTLGCWQGGDTAPPVAPVVGVNSSELSCGWGRCCWHKMEVSLFPVTRVHLQHTVLCPMWVLEHIAGASTSWSKSFEPTCPFLHTSWGPLFTPLALVLFVSHHCYSLPLLLCQGYPISPCQVSKKKKICGNFMEIYQDSAQPPSRSPSNTYKVSVRPPCIILCKYFCRSHCFHRLYYISRVFPFMKLRCLWFWLLVKIQFKIIWKNNNLIEMIFI